MDQIHGIPNLMQLEDDIIGGGLPTEEAIDELKNQGFKTIIDLRTPPEGTHNMQQHVQALGFSYYNIPVTSWGIGDDQVTLLDNILSNADNRPALVHCAIGGRVQMMWDKYKNNN